MPGADEVLDFWTSIGPKGWFEVNPAVDAQITAQFQPIWGELWEGGLRSWQDTVQGALAYLIVADQFPRNMFRGDARSFATDDRARAAARRAILSGLDLQTDAHLRAFFYLPFMHSETMGDQDWSVDLYETRLPNPQDALHAKAHREVIRRFGRFPYRNQALSRQNTVAEAAFLADGGYGSILRELAG
jgi:uncharacterized protein (DUF924 family)